MAKMMLYNGVLLPDIESVWTDKYKQSYPFLSIELVPSENIYKLWFLNSQLSPDNSNNYFYTRTGYLAYSFKIGSTDDWAIADRGTNNTSRILIGYSGNTIIWTNHDLLNTDGSIYLAASAPVDPNAPTFTPADFAKWFLLGQSVRRGVRKEATMYSYNGVVLPDIYKVYTPELQKTHPFASIGVRTDGYCLLLKDYDLSVSPEGTFWITPGLKWIYVDGVWQEHSTYVYPMVPVWSNYDIHYAEEIPDIGGTVYLPASNPVPVYE